MSENSSTFRIHAANTISSNSFYQKINYFDKLPTLKSPHDFLLKYDFKNIRMKLKLYEMSEVGKQEMEKQSSRFEGEIRKDQVLLDTKLYESIYLNFLNEETKELTVMECSQFLHEILTNYLKEQDIWDSEYISLGGLYMSLNDVHVFFNIEKKFFLSFTDSTYETSRFDYEELLKNKNFFILQLVLSHFLIKKSTV